MRKLTLLLIILTLVSAQTVFAGVDIIVNSSVSDNSVDKATIQKVFLGKKSALASGTKVVPVMLKSGASYESFLNDVVGKSPNQFNTFWKQAVFSGKGTPPKSFASEAELVKFVESTPGAIGYITKGGSAGGAKKISLQ